MDDLEKNTFLDDYLDQIRITILFGKLNRENLHIYLPFKNAFYYHRVNLNPKLESNCEILSEKEIFDDIDDLYEKAKAQARKFNERKFDNAAVLFVEDELDIPVEESCGFTLDQKLKMTLLLYVLKGNMPANVDTGE